MPSITLGQFIDNIEKNGVPHIQGEFLKRTDYETRRRENVIGACALGQGSLNTFDDEDIFTPHGTFWTQLSSIISESSKFDYPRNFVNYIIRLNDVDYLSLPEIVSRARKDFANELDTVIEWED